MNKDKPHPSKGWGDVEVGDLVYYMMCKDTHSEMGIVLKKEGGAAVVYLYGFKDSKLTRTINLLKVDT